MGFFSAPKQKLRTYEVMTPGQKQAYGGVSDYLSSRVGQGVAPFGYGPWTPWAKQAYKRYRKPALREFEQRILPAIREQYAGTGSLFGGRRYQAEGEAGVRLAEHLGAKRFEYERQAFTDYLRTVPEMNPALQMLLAALQIPMFGTYVKNAPAGTGRTLLQEGIKGLGTAAGMSMYGLGAGGGSLSSAFSAAGSGGGPLMLGIGR